MGKDDQIDEGSVQPCFLKCMKHEREERACWVELVVTLGHNYVALLALHMGEQRMNQGFEAPLPILILCIIFKVHVFILCAYMNVCSYTCMCECMYMCMHVCVEVRN